MSRRRGPLVLAAGSMLDHPAEVLIAAAGGAGFDGVGLRISGEHVATDPGALRARAAEHGVMVHDAEVYRIGSGIDPVPLIGQAVAVGAAALLVVSDLADRAGTVDALGDLVERCARVGLRVGLEYMAWTTPDSPEAAMSIADEVGCRLVVDLLHHVRVGAGRRELAAIADAGLLDWVQICDAPAEPAGSDLIDEARHGRSAPGLGALPIDELLRAVPADTVISVEVQSDRLKNLAPAERARLLHETAGAVLGGG